MASRVAKRSSASATPEDGEDVVEEDLVAAVGAELLERPEGVAEAPGRVAGEEGDGRRRDDDALGLGRPAQDGGDLVGRRPLEVEAVAAVDHRGQDLLGLGGGEDEDGVGRGLLERLEEGVPGGRREHVGLVEDVDLLAAGDRGVGDRLAQGADVVDRVRRGGVHLDHVERRRGGDRDARLAGAARLGRRRVLAVEAGGEDLGHRRLAGPPRADEEVGVVDHVAVDGVAQRPDDVLLADDLGEAARTVATVERGAGRHGRPVYLGVPPGSGAGAGDASTVARAGAIACRGWRAPASRL
jgi:hypothetical protein